ncbi:MAG: hypothetical protein LAT77_02025 [Aliidiomarina sp.]|uniref:hypothetical protein n=1 Tax=Aliidiomarina sp. TaxID=1872439 RepID=UPI0025BE3891|nr:hypothetical protein [Aliidiomarina sp.]MCH8500669.1 hypothetical protein [Aliidiomarina sp.]
MRINPSVFYQCTAPQRFIAYLLVLLSLLVVVSVSAGGHSRKQVATVAPVAVQPRLPGQTISTLPSSLLASGSQHQVIRLRSYGERADIELSGTLQALSLWLQVALLSQWRVENVVMRRDDTSLFHLALQLEYSSSHTESIAIVSAAERLLNLAPATPTELSKTESETTITLHDRCDNPPELQLSAYLKWITSEVEPFDLPSTVATLKGETFYRVKDPIIEPTAELILNSSKSADHNARSNKKTLFSREDDDCQYEIAFPSSLQQAQLSWLDDYGPEPHRLP